ncbi:MAG: thiolase family protein [Chloroflexota bacterium]
MNDVFLIGIAMTKFGKYPGKTIKQLTAEVVHDVLQDANVSKQAIQAVWFANSGWGRLSGQDAIRGQTALRPLGIERIPITNVENACAGGSTALNAAYMAIAGGVYEVALVVGVEKTFDRDKMKVFAGFLGGTDVEDFSQNLSLFDALEQMISIRSNQWMDDASPKKNGLNWMARLSRLPDQVKQTIIYSDLYGRKNFHTLIERGMAKSRSPFMDVYSLAARVHMDTFGTTQRQLAIIAAKNHWHGSLNPQAQYTQSMTPEQVLADTHISYPLTRAMCAPVGDGAAAAIVCSKGFLRSCEHTGAVRIRASVLGSGRTRAFDEEDSTIALGRRAFELAGVGSEDINFAELHDATAFGELHHSEMLGFCREGEGGRFAESGATRLGGRLPINTSGGLESRGHPVAATGLAQVYELALQLRGRADRRQVPNARIGLAQNGGGIIGIEEAAMCIHILEAPHAN